MNTIITINSIHNFTSQVNKLKKKWSKIYVLVDENTKELCLPTLFETQDFFNNAEIIEIDSGEDSKSIEICYQIWGMMLETGADRNSLLVNLGGGGICDLGGFVASTFKRGIDFINIPTTLLAQVDAAIGGKVAINYEGLKNQIGLFRNPILTFIDTQFTSTQQKREFTSGLAEVLKYGLTLKESLFTQIVKTIDFSKDLEFIVKQCVELKTTIVEVDFKDAGVRKKLNFGHTIGHAIETLFKGDVLHGEAIAVGLICESYISNQINGLKAEDIKLIASTVNKMFTKLIFTNSNFEELLAIMKIDKKNEANQINFTLLSKIGTSTINHTVSEELIIKALAFYLEGVD